MPENLTGPQRALMVATQVYCSHRPKVLPQATVFCLLQGIHTKRHVNFYSDPSPFQQQRPIKQELKSEILQGPDK